VILVGLQPEKLLSMATNVRYQALFSEVGGIMPGNDVTVSGMKVGTVQDVSLRDGDALVTFLVKGAVELEATPPRTSAPEPCSVSGC
jgi:phospholipid/cholesterol/gamma-HCH transport system substrate-binding protein